MRLSAVSSIAVGAVRGGALSSPQLSRVHGFISVVIFGNYPMWVT